MNKKLDKIGITELEISVKTINALLKHEVSNLEELLKLPKINCSKMSKMELQLLFSDFGITYNGVFETSIKQAIIKPKGDIIQTWKTIEKWLRKNYPERLLEFSEPAKETEIQKVEAELNCKLPEDFRKFYKIHNGQKNEDEPMLHYVH